MKIVHVEDSATIRYQVQQLLQAMQHQVIDVTDGQTALETIARERPDVVLMDYQLPGINGVDITRQLKADDRLRQIPVIALTSDVETRQAFADAGSDGYLNKPVRQIPLLKTIARVITAV